MCNVIPVKCKRVSTHTLMFWAGLGNVAFSFLCIPLPKVNLDTVFDPFNLGKCCRPYTHIQLWWTRIRSFNSNNEKVIYLCFIISFEELIQWITVMVLGSLAVVINQLLIYANILSSPPVNSMVSYIGGKICLEILQKLLVS